MSRPRTAGDDLRVEIVGGGRPDAVTTAAIAVAVRSVLAGRGALGRSGAVTPAWRRAALREGVGGAPEIRPDGRG